MYTKAGYRKIPAWQEQKQREHGDRKKKEMGL